ncbi:MAG: Uma2 family endonuclease [Lachnospiraceae bacterium]|nr:Uma2 family endonuclease [Lachnospiraceae bacterium]
MDVMRKDEIYTIDDIYALPQGARAEIVDGKIYYMAPPSRTHQRLLHFFDVMIENYIQAKNGSCEVYPAPFAVFLDPEDDTTYFEPDISVICDTSKLDEKGCHGAPDWIIEIVSPGSKSMDYFTKLVKYQAANVREYWIVNPVKEQIIVYQFEDGKVKEVEQYSFAEEVPVGIYEGFSIKVQ